MPFREIDLTITVPSTASTTTYGTAFPGFGEYDAIKGLATLQGLTGGTLNIYIQQSWDGGTTWTDCAAFAQMSGGAAQATSDFSIVLDSTIRTVGSGSVSSAAPALSAGTICAGPWAPLLRLVAVSGSGTSGASKLQTVKLYAWSMKR